MARKVLLFLALMCSTAVGAVRGTVRASYYSNKFAGKRTANGETYDPQKFTTAHRTLPFGTCLLVTRLGRAVRVRVNDRGPWRAGRGLDLSRAAAKALDILSLGTATVHYKVIECH